MSQPWTSERVRETFLEFYRAGGERAGVSPHRRMGSLALIPPGDPTLLFTNAGMVQFKDVFTGKRKVDYGTATTSQKCLRVSGKHNDLENVGRTARHHTFFEMLGNFSFGDYFKEGAIRSAWTLLTEIYGLPKEKLWVTTHPDDAEARALWRRISGLPDERILPDPENFWSMGETGACGPCSEIYVDQGSALSGGVEVPFGEGGDRYLEIWNLVFMQYERHADGTLTPLPRPSIDTGMGLERITAVLQGKTTNYDSDLFGDIIQHMAQDLAKSHFPTGDEERDVAFRVMADHARAATFVIADGIYPGNEGREYVLRRVMRRALRFNHKLSPGRPFFAEVCAKVIEKMSVAYPELLARREVVLEVVRREQDQFGRTLASGLKRLEETFQKNAQSRTVPGDVAFELHDTFGFPLDLTEQAAGERGFGVDLAGFHAALEAQKERGRASWKGVIENTAVWETLREAHGPVETLYYTHDAAEATVLAVVGDGTGVVTQRTPFYAESGGQVGDTGEIRGEDGAVFLVEDTQSPVEGVTVHQGRFLEGTFAPNTRVQLTVDAARRNLTRRNHSATHLLHFALRTVLGDHVKQKGSLVGPHRLRFDFSHYKPLTTEDVRAIERLVNERIVQNAPAVTEVLPKDAAMQKGAIAFFGDKYGETVRVLTLTPDSVEFCGGTHVRATGDIGAFRIISDGAIAAGTRRIEAATGLDALELGWEREDRLHAVAEAVKASPTDLLDRVKKLRDEHTRLEAELAQLRAKERQAGVADAQPEQAGTIAVIALVLDGVAGGDLRDMADKARQKLGSGAVLLASNVAGKAALLVAVTDDLKGRINAGKLVGELAPLVGGRGGGRPDLAQAGGDDPSQLPAVVAKFKALVASLGG